MPLSADADNNISNNSSNRYRETTNDTDEEIETVRVAIHESNIVQSSTVEDGNIVVETPERPQTNASVIVPQMTSLPNDSSSNNLSPSMDRTGTNSGTGTSRSSPMSAFRFTRDIIERRAHEQTRNWRDNLSNVFMEIRPLVQQAQNVNNSSLLSSWLPTNSRPVHRPNDLISDRIRSLNQLNNPSEESVIINFDATTASNQSPTSLAHSHLVGGHSGPTENYTRLLFHNQHLYSHHHGHHHHAGAGSGGIGERIHSDLPVLGLHDNNDDGGVPVSSLGGHSSSGQLNPLSSPSAGGAAARNHAHHHNHHNQQPENAEGPVTEAFAQVCWVLFFLHYQLHIMVLSISRIFLARLSFRTPPIQTD